MSRIGKVPVNLPKEVSARLEGNTILVEGPKGKLVYQVSPLVTVAIEDSLVVVRSSGGSRQARMLFGTTRALIANMVKGVSEGFSKQLEISGVGFKAALKGNILHLELGYSHPIDYVIREGVTVVVLDNTKLTVSGADKASVGQVAADIKGFYPVEPYKAKGVRIIGEFVRRKEGKKTA